MSSRQVNGMHWPNLTRWHLQQLLEAAGPSGAISLLHHDLWPDDPMTGHHGDEENLFVYGPVRFGRDPAIHGGGAMKAHPDLLIHIRAYENGQWREIDPEAWGRHIARTMSGWSAHNYPEVDLTQDPLVVVSFCNEQNIEGWVVSELGGEVERTKAYTEIGLWQHRAMLAFDDEIAAMGKQRKCLIAWGALAFGHDAIPGVPDSEYRVPAIREAIEYADVLTCHPYAIRDMPTGRADSTSKDRWFFMLRPWRAPGTDGHPLGGCATQFPHKPVLITETGTFEADRDPLGTVRALEALYRYASETGQCIGITPFMWMAGPEHAMNGLNSPEIRAALAGMPKYPAIKLPMAGERQDPAPVPPIDPLPPAPPETDGPFAAIRVQPGEGMYSVARRAGYATRTVQEAAVAIAHANGKSWPPDLKRGEVLVLPGMEIIERREPGGEPPAPGPTEPPAMSLTDMLYKEFGSLFYDLREQMPTNPNSPHGQYGTQDPTGSDITIHHTVTPTWEIPAGAKSIASYHVNGPKQRPGIAYHFLVDAEGRVAYVGDIKTARAHVAGLNHRRMGIAYLGQCQPGVSWYAPPTDRAVDAMSRLVAVLRTVSRTAVVRGHRQEAGSQTACPGDALVAALPTIAGGRMTSLLAQSLGSMRPQRGPLDTE